MFTCQSTAHFLQHCQLPRSLASYRLVLVHDGQGGGGAGGLRTPALRDTQSWKLRLGLGHKMVVDTPFCLLMKKYRSQNGRVELCLCCLPLAVAATAHSSPTRTLSALPIPPRYCSSWGLGPLRPRLDQGEAQGARYLLKMQNQCKGHTYFSGQAEATPTVSEVKPWTWWKPQWPWKRTGTRQFGMCMPWVPPAQTPFLWPIGEPCPRCAGETHQEDGDPVTALRRLVAPVGMGRGSLPKAHPQARLEPPEPKQVAGLLRIPYNQGFLPEPLCRL